MQLFYMILLLLALVCFVAATFRTTSPKVELTALGLALFVAVPFIQTLQKL
jgi:endonuclease/exonuclease/phosphatase family metal-dependent hydrolase